MLAKTEIKKVTNQETYAKAMAETLSALKGSISEEERNFFNNRKEQLKEVAKDKNIDTNDMDLSLMILDEMENIKSEMKELQKQ